MDINYVEFYEWRKKQQQHVACGSMVNHHSAKFMHKLLLFTI